MLIEFRVENHRSLRDEQALTFAAGRIGDPSDPRLRTVGGCNDKLLPAAVIYGANASGKSNVLAALAFMREAVLASQRRWEPDGGIPRVPFAWGEKRLEPSVFEVFFSLGGSKYQYGFAIDDLSVREEWLYAWPKQRRQIWFEREDTRFKFGEHLRGQNESIGDMTRPNALFLSAAAQFGHPHLQPLYGWFATFIRSFPRAVDIECCMRAPSLRSSFFQMNRNHPSFGRRKKRRLWQSVFDV